MPVPQRLAPILKAVAERSAERRSQRSLSDLRAELEVNNDRCSRFVGALSHPGLGLIAECKRKAPSTGELCAEENLDQRLRDYARGGANAFSILTETDHFGGCLADLQAAPDLTLPRIRKDFLLDEAMVLEAQVAGAHAVLLIAACLDPSLLAELRGVAREAGLAVLLEVHNEAELDLALPLAPEAVGVNARNLDTFEVDLGVTERLLPLIPTEMLRVAESGMHCLEDLQRMRLAGADAALVGTALMRSSNPAGLLMEWRSGLDG